MMIINVLIFNILISGWGVPLERPDFKNFPERADWTWERSRPEGGIAEKISVDPSNPYIVYCASTFWFWRSNDGSSWFPLDFGLPEDLTATGSLRGVAENEDSLYYTNDGGLTWTQISPFGYDNPHVLEYAPSNPDIIFAGAFLNDTSVILKSDTGE